MKNYLLLLAFIFMQACYSGKEITCAMTSTVLINMADAILSQDEVKSKLNKCTSYTDTIYFLNKIDSLNFDFSLENGKPYDLEKHIIVFYSLGEMFFYNKSSWIEITKIWTRREEVNVRFMVICKANNHEVDPLIGNALFNCKGTKLHLIEVSYE